MPPRKDVEDGKVDIHAAFTPLSTPLAFSGKSSVCSVVGSNVCFWDLESRKRTYLHTSAFSITKVCGNPEKNLIAFCEGGCSPQVFIYSLEPQRLLHTLSNITELELADMQFSRCGSRFYTLSRATEKKLCVFSTSSGAKLPGGELGLSLRFDKLSVFPGHKDQVALIRSSSVRIVTLQKSYKTYIMQLQPASIPIDTDVSVSAYSWTPTGNFMFATRQGLLCIMDGKTGDILYACQADSPITSLVVTRLHVITAHIGNTIKFWQHDPAQLASPDINVMLSNAPLMESEQDQGIFRLDRNLDLETMASIMPPEHALHGQVAHVQLAPDNTTGVLTTAEGEVWTFRLPPNLTGADGASAGESGAEEAEEPTGEEIQVGELSFRLLTWFHTHPVSDISVIGRSSRLCASIDEGGRLRIWDLADSKDPKGFRVLRFTSALTSLTCDDEGKIILVGSDSGCVHVVDCSNWRQAQVLDTVRVSEAGVAQLRSVTHEGRCISAAAMLFNNKIAFLTVAFKEPSVRMAGLVDVQGTIEDIAFHVKDFRSQSVTPPRLLAVGACYHSGAENPIPCLWAIRAPPLDHVAQGVELKREVCPMWSMKLSADSRLEGKATAISSATKKSVVVGFADGRMKIYLLEKVSTTPLSKQSVAPEYDSISPPHDQLVACLNVSQDGVWLISASMDGSVRRFPLERGSKIGEADRKVLHNPYNGGVVRVSMSNDNAVIISTGGSDGVLVWSSPGAPVDVVTSAPPPAVASENHSDEPLRVDVDDRDLALFPVWEPTSQEDKAGANPDADDPELSGVIVAQKKALVVEVEALRKKLRLLMDANTHCPDLEKLERDEFCVDWEERDKIAATTKERCDILRAEIERENLARQLIRDRLIKEFWDPMRTKGCQICSLQSNLAVSNYPERSISDEESTITRKLKIMRQTETLELQMLQANDCPRRLKSDVILKADQFTTGDEQYIVNWWTAGQGQGGAANAKKAESKAEEAKEDGGDEKADEKADQQADEKAEKEVVSAHSVQRLLYEPFELLTGSRRRLQIHLLQCLAAEYRAAFQELFVTCQAEKSGVMDGIKEKTKRIRSILGELQWEEDVPEPELRDAEEAEAVLGVKDREIAAEKWISEADRKAAAAAAAVEAERLRQLAENDSGQRALNSMMGGTLKTKKDLSPLEITLDKEPWMDQIPEDDMTDAQKQAFKEFQEKEKLLLEEQDKYRKQLDAELKKLREEVQQLMQQFEVTLKDLHHQRFVHDAKFFCQELYCVRLQLALLQSVEDSQVLEKSVVGLGEAEEKYEVNRTKHDVFEEDVLAAQKKQEERVKQERDIKDAGLFRKQFADSALEQEDLTALLALFRRRRDANAHQRASTNQGDSRGASPDPDGHPGRSAPLVLDPYEASAIRIPGGPWPDAYPDMGSREHPDELDMPEEKHDDEKDLWNDCPENVDEASFRKMLELRRRRNLAEGESQKFGAILHEMGGLLSHLQGEQDESRREHERLDVELQEHRHLMARELHDVEILFRLKQGQVEVPQAAVVTDYSDAVVIDKEVVECRNGRIQELGKEKTGTLETTKEFRKKLNLIHWEHKMLALQTTDLEERTKDVHMLRVTKELQSVLKGGEEGRNKADADLLERKIEHLSTTTQQKEQSLKKQYAMSSHATKLRRMENSMLEKKLRELQQNVIQREHIRRLRAPAGGGAQGGGGRKEGDKPRIIGGGGRIEENEAEIHAAQSGFREVRTKNTLMEAAKKHTDEIDLLRKELDRLRQKTFPSFVQVHEDRPANPDHF